MKRILYLLTVMIVCIAMINFTFIFPQPPKEFVQNLTVHNTENLFFKKHMTRYPVTGMVVNTTLGEKNQTLIPIGVAAEATELNFGRVAITTKVRKILFLKNNENLPAKFHLRMYGNISEFTEFERDFILNPKETKEIKIIFNAFKLGNYTGEFDVIAFVPKFPLFTYLLFMM